MKMKKSILLTACTFLAALSAAAEGDNPLFTVSNRGTSNSSMATQVLQMDSALSSVSASGAMYQDAISYTPSLKGNNGASSRVVEGGPTAASGSVAIARASTANFDYTMDLSFHAAPGSDKTDMRLSALTVDFAMLRERYTRSFGDDSHGHTGEAVHFGADITYRYALMDTTHSVELASGLVTVNTPAGKGCNPLESITDAVNASVYSSANPTLLSSAMTGARSTITLAQPLTLAAGTEYSLEITLESVKVEGTGADVILNTHINDENLVRYTNYSNYVAIGNISAYGEMATPTTPEPTTASLSLLALSGLCARRRRKIH